MKSASFFFLSVSLHAAALAYPVWLGRSGQAELIHVTILPLEQAGGSPDGEGGNGSPVSPSVARSHNLRPPAAEPRVEPKSHRATPPPVESRVELKPGENSAPQASTAAEVETDIDGRIALTTTNSASFETDGSTIFGYAIDDMPGAGAGTGATGTSGYGPNGAGAGSGSGNGAGIGAGSPGRGIVLTQARYRDTPRPDYPERARRQGREGRVLLRVLVDAQGRSRKVEIHSSSGSDELDRAAAEAIKRWRFHPTRHGERPVESWLRVPIEFRLEDANH